MNEIEREYKKQWGTVRVSVFLLLTKKLSDTTVKLGYNEQLGTDKISSL